MSSHDQLVGAPLRADVRPEPETQVDSGGASEARRRGSIARLATATYFGLALGFVTSPIVARVLGPHVRGQYAAVYVFSTALMTVLALGIPMAIVYRLVNKLDEPERLLGTVLRFCAALLLPGAAIAVVVTTGVLELPEGTATYLAIVALGLAPAGVLGVCLQGFLISGGALGPLAWIRMAPLLANFVGVVALAVLGQLTLVSYLALTVAISLFSLALVWHFVDLRPRGHARFRALIGFGLKSYPGSFARMLNFQVDQIILVPLVTPAELAYYAIAVTIAQLPQTLPEAIGTRAVGSIIGDERLLLAHKAEEYLRINLLVSVVACVGIAAVAPFLVPLLYGHAFDGIVAPLLLLLPGAIATAGTTLAVSCLTAIGRPGVTSFAEVSSLVITGVGLWLALPRFGISGAAAVSSIAYCYRYGVQLVVLRRHGVKKLMPRRSDIVKIIRVIPRPGFRAAGGLG